MMKPLRVATGMRGRLTLAIAGLVGGIAVFVALFFPWRLEQQALRATVSRVEATHAMTAQSVRAALVFGDTVGVHEVLSAALADNNVLCARVEEANGGLMTMAGREQDVCPPRAPGMSADGQLYVGTADVVHGDTDVGRVSMTFSLAALRDEVALARRTGVVFGALILIFGVLTGYALAALITMPVRQVALTVRAIREHDLSARAVVPLDPDVAELACAFNELLDRVAGAQHQLADVNADLERRVFERTERLRMFYRVSPQPVLAVDLEGRVTLWNSMAEQLFGWRSEEVLGRPIPYVPPEERESFDRMQAMMRGGEIVKAREVVRMKRDGTRVPLLLSAAPVRDAKGNIAGCAAILTDLTERKALEQQLAQSQKMEAVGRLAGGIAHDFNNVLTVITATSSLLLESGLQGQQREDVEAIEHAAHRAAGLTRQLLAFSRSKAVQLAPVRLDDVVREMEPMLRRVLRENVRLEVRATDTQAIHADVTEIEQILMNLVVNASDAMPRGGTLTLSTEDVTLDADCVREHPEVNRGDYVRLSVTDTGVGMAPAILTKIFEPFFTTKPVGKGTGLGLATTYAIVRRLNGTIEVRSRVGEGTSFIIHVPRMAPRATEASRPAASGSSLQGTERVLLVEDETTVRFAMRRSLERLGYHVVDVDSGEAALEQIRAGDPFDVVVTDIMMPGINGSELAEELARSHPHLPVIFMSGYADDTIGDAALVDDTHRFLHKPVTGIEISRAIREFVRPVAA